MHFYVLINLMEMGGCIYLFIFLPSYSFPSSLHSSLPLYTPFHPSLPSLPSPLCTPSSFSKPFPSRPHSLLPPPFHSPFPSLLTSLISSTNMRNSNEYPHYHSVSSHKPASSSSSLPPLLSSLSSFICHFRRIMKYYSSKAFLTLLVHCNH